MRSLFRESGLHRLACALQADIVVVAQMVPPRAADEDHMASLAFSED